MAESQIIYTKEIGTVLIILTGGNTIKLHNIVLVLGFDSNLISLGQFRKSRITYHDNLTTMMLMKDRKVIAEVKREQNLFTLNLAYPGKTIAIISP